MAAEVEWLKVKRTDGRIYVHAAIIIDAPAPAVYAALLEYDEFAKFSDVFAG